MERTDKVVREVTKLVLVAGTAHAVPSAGFDGATFTNAPNSGVVFAPLEPFDERVAKGITTAESDRLRAKFATIQEAFVINPPPVRGIGTAAASRWMSRTAAAAGWRRWRP